MGFYKTTRKKVWTIEKKKTLTQNGFSTKQINTLESLNNAR